MAKNPNIRHDRFWAGISQDDRLQQDGEYTYGRDINIRQGQFIELEKGATNITGVSESWSINTQYYFGKYFLGCSDGHIRTSTDLVTFTDVYTGDEEVLGMVFTDNTLFWWTENLYYYRTDAIDANPWVLSTNVFRQIVSASTQRQVIHYSADLIYFINGNGISYIDVDVPGNVINFGSFTSGGGAFAARDRLVGLTEHANSFWAYDSGGRMYVIDQSIQAVTSVKNFKEPIIGVYNNSDFDIVLTESGTYYKAAYMNGGVGPNSHTLLRRYLYSEYNYLLVNGTTASDGIRFNFIMKDSVDNSFCENNTITYFLAEEGGEEVIYSFGRKNNALPPSLSIVASKREDGTSFGTISAIWIKDSYLYIAGNSGVTRYVEKIPVEDAVEGAIYADSGYILTRVDSGGIYEKPKQAGKLTIGADIPDGTSIKIYYSMDGSAFTLLGTEIGFDEIQGGTGTATLIQRTIPSQSFNELAIKVELLTSDSTISPRLFSLEYLPSIVKLN